MKSLTSHLTLASLFVLSASPLHAESRAWSNREGETIQAELVTYDSETKKSPSSYQTAQMRRWHSMHSAIPINRG